MAPPAEHKRSDSPFRSRGDRLLAGDGLFGRLWRLALPYLDTRQNEIHTRLSVGLALHLLELENGSAPVVLPAVILHDVGWKRVPEEQQLEAFGPRAARPELNRVHELAGVEIAGKLLEEAWPESPFREEILAIVEGHDSRLDPISQNDRLVKDADKLWRYTREGFAIDIKRFDETRAAGLGRLRENLPRWFLTATGRATARRLLRQRERQPPAAR
jgi:hypothetical protein